MPVDLSLRGERGYFEDVIARQRGCGGWRGGGCLVMRGSRWWRLGGGSVGGWDGGIDGIGGGYKRGVGEGLGLWGSGWCGRWRWGGGVGRREIWGLEFDLIG